MKSRLIHEQHGVLVGRARFGEFVEADLGGVRRHLRHDQRKGFIRSRTNRAEDVAELEALIAQTRRALAACKPAVRDAPFLPGARFVLEPDRDFLGLMWSCNLLENGGNVF